MCKQDDLNVIGFLREIWMARAFLAVGLFFGLFLSLCILGVVTPKVEARIMLGLVQPMEAAVQAQFQNGSNLYAYSHEQGEPDSVSRFTRFEAMTGGVSVAKILLRDRRIMDGIVADKRFVFQRGRQGADVLGADFGAADLAQYIQKHVRFDSYGESALKEMVYRHSDGVFAAYLLQQIHRVSDQLIRADLRAQVDERISYLERAIGKMNNPEQRRIMTNLLLEQERMLMMVSMDAPVAASVIEPASFSARVVWPNPYLFYGVFGLIGLLVGYLVFGVVYALRMEAIEANAAPKLRGEDLRHQPKRPLKYGSWFQNAPDNANDMPQDIERGLARKRDVSDAAE